MTEETAVHAQEPHSDESRFPWPPAPGESALTAFFESWRQAVFHPASFFRRLPTSGGYGPYLLFYLMVGVLAAGIELFWRHVYLQLGGATGSGLMSLLGGEGDPLSPLLGFLLSPLILITLLFVGGGLIHLVLVLTGGSRHGFATTVRTLSFSYSPQIFSIVPLIGSLIGFVWMIAIGIIGLREAHGTDSWRAAIAVLVPVGFFLVLMMVAAFLAVLFSEGLAGSA